MAKGRERKKAGSVDAGLELVNTGVPGLNEVLGGGLPSLSFNLIAGGPGSGKTTLAMQMLFANATVKRPGLFITLLGETSLKMLRYQQQLEFFETKCVGVDVHFLNLTKEALSGDLEAVLERIVREVEHLQPGVIVVDSFRSLVDAREGEEGPQLELEHFVQRMALHLTTWEVTSYLIGEYHENELRNPVFTVADGIVWLTQATDRNSVVRKLQIVKMRGMSIMPGLHTMKLSKRGVQVYPRIPERGDDVRKRGTTRLSTGIAGLDEMMGGGFPAGDSVVLAGPTGAGKTTFAMQFVTAGLRKGEAAVIAIFEEHPEVYLARAKSFGVDLNEAIKKGKLRILYLRPLDLSVDETLDDIRNAVEEMDATRVVIDSISGFEMALAPTFRADFRESLYRLIGALTGLGVTIFSTVEVVGASEGLQFTGYQVSFLTDDIISQRYVEIEGELRKALVVVKMRGGEHSLGFRVYEMTASGVLMREWLNQYDNITGGTPTRALRFAQPSHPGLVEREVQALETIVRSGPMTSSDLEARAGLTPDEAETVLGRLVFLRYVHKKGSRYEAEVRPSGH